MVMRCVDWFHCTYFVQDVWWACQKLDPTDILARLCLFRCFLPVLLVRCGWLPPLVVSQALFGCPIKHVASRVSSTSTDLGCELRGAYWISSNALLDLKSCFLPIYLHKRTRSETEMSRPLERSSKPITSNPVFHGPGTPDCDCDRVRGRLAAGSLPRSSQDADTPAPTRPAAVAAAATPPPR